MNTAGSVGYPRPAPPEVGGEPAWVLERQPVARQLDNNLKCVDLSDLAGDLPLDVVRSTEILRRTEPWENDSLGYPTVVRNDCGPHPDGRYYLYYAHHDLESGIGCAVAESIEGPYVKRYPLCWSESQPYDADQKIIYGRTRDFRTVGARPPWRPASADGRWAGQPRAEGERLYLFAGRFVHVLDLPVREHRNDSQPSHEGEP